MIFHVLLVIFIAATATAQYDPHFLENRTVIVHLFEWKWDDVARECEEFLGPHGVGGIQVSPPNENSVITQRPWWERYQPVSYILQTRSGNEDQFRRMVRKCTDAGVRVYVDAVINHMSATKGRGTAGSISDPDTMNYPGVPYTTTDFHPPCQIVDYSEPYQVRNCQLVGLPDLNQTLNWVQDRVEDYLNHLVDCGVAGFRVDAAKHMWPADLKQMYERTNDLSTAHGFKRGSRPFIYQEVIDLGGEGISSTEYTPLGRVTEFRASAEIGKLLRGRNNLTFVDSWGTGWGFLPSDRSVVFVENHDSERGQGAGGSDVLTYKDGKLYRMAVAFTLAHPFGIPKVMSGFAFHRSDQGPPANPNGDIISPEFNSSSSCTNGWVCQHRWRQTYKMVQFRNAAGDAPVSRWWSNGDNQIAFAREGRGFMAINNEERDLNVTLNTGLTGGSYCDLMTGDLQDNKCTGGVVVVDSKGLANLFIGKDASEGVVAICVEERVKIIADL